MHNNLPYGLTSHGRTHIRQWWGYPRKTILMPGELHDLVHGEPYRDGITNKITGSDRMDPNAPSIYDTRGRIGSCPNFYQFDIYNMSGMVDDTNPNLLPFPTRNPSKRHYVGSVKVPYWHPKNYNTDHDTARHPTHCWTLRLMAAIIIEYETGQTGLADEIDKAHRAFYRAEAASFRAAEQLRKLGYDAKYR